MQDDDKDWDKMTAEEQEDYVDAAETLSGNLISGLARTANEALTTLVETLLHPETDTPDSPSPEALEQVFSWLKGLSGTGVIAGVDEGW